MIGRPSHMLPVEPQEAGMTGKGYCWGRHWTLLSVHNASGFNMGEQGETREPLCRSPSRRPLAWSALVPPTRACRETGSTNNKLPTVGDVWTNSCHRQQIYKTLHRHRGCTLTSTTYCSCISLLCGYASPSGSHTQHQDSRVEGRHGNFHFLSVPPTYLVTYRVPTLRNHSAAAIENRRPDSPLQHPSYLKHISSLPLRTRDSSLLLVADSKQTTQQLLDALSKSQLLFAPHFLLSIA